MKRLGVSIALLLAFTAQGCLNTAVTPAAASAQSAMVNLGALPLDDGHYSTAAPKRGWVYACQTPHGPVANGNPPWIDTAAGTWNMREKIAVRGAVKWKSRIAVRQSGSIRAITGNGLPSHATGTFPIAATDPAYQYDRNPNSIAAQSLDDRIPANPKAASTPSCLNMGPIGVMLTGAQLFDALDADGRDAAAHEVLDNCWGHPEMTGTYHYHAFSSCMGDSASGHSKLLGYALDGFGIYGPRGEHGEILSDADLDVCHGHTHKITWNGKRVVMYHYHFTYEYPYSLGCYRGTR